MRRFFRSFCFFWYTVLPTYDAPPAAPSLPLSSHQMIKFSNDCRLSRDFLFSLFLLFLALTKPHQPSTPLDAADCTEAPPPSNQSTGPSAPPSSFDTRGENVGDGADVSSPSPWLAVSRGRVGILDIPVRNASAAGYRIAKLEPLSPAPISPRKSSEARRVEADAGSMMRIVARLGDGCGVKRRAEMEDVGGWSRR